METEDEVFQRFNEESVPAEGQREEVYLDYLKSLEGPSGFWDRGKGWLSWLQGRALNRLVDSVKRKGCRHGAYGRVLAQVGMTKSTAWWCRQIDLKCSAAEARTLGFTQMLYRIKAIKTTARRPGQKRTSRGYIQEIGAFCKYLDRLDLREVSGDERYAVLDRLVTLGQAVDKAVRRLEPGRKAAAATVPVTLKYPGGEQGRFSDAAVG